MPRSKTYKIEHPTRHLRETWAQARPDIDPADYLFLMHVTRLGRTVDQLDDRYFRSTFGMSGSDMRILFVLRRTAADWAPRPIDLANTLLVTTGAITKQLDRLERRGLVRRIRSRAAANDVLVTATQEGLEIADRGLDRMIDSSPLSAIRDALTKSERIALSDLCQKALEDLEMRQGNQIEAADQ